TVNILVSAIILLKMNLVIFGLVLLFVVPHIIISRIFIARAMPELNKNSLEATAINTAEFSSIINCAETAALYDGYDYLLKRFEQGSLRLLRANMKIRIRSALSAGIMPILGGGGYLVLLIVSGVWIAEGNFTFGDLTAAFQYRGGVLLGSMMLINSMISIQSSMAGIKRINETMSEKTEETDG
ncbi:MAG: ABC transporter transmembrane domain-containing protein, partial [Treponema sp.]|nr:ABC transporter transmembrane domain-containing protein [Treponema sp.]